jgi:hypothetical protein
MYARKLGVRWLQQQPDNFILGVASQSMVRETSAFESHHILCSRSSILPQPTWGEFGYLFMTAHVLPQAGVSAQFVPEVRNVQFRTACFMPNLSGRPIPCEYHAVHPKEPLQEKPRQLAN